MQEDSAGGPDLVVGSRLVMGGTVSIAGGRPQADGRLRVLVVEDLPSDAELMVLRLEEEGFVTDWQRVQSEQELRAALQVPPDVILSDWRLPRFSGLRALEVVREITPEMPFLIVSGNIGEEAAIEALHRGADDYVLKDRLGRLGPAVRRAMEASRLRAEQRVAEVQLAFQAEILGNVRDAVVALDLEATVVYWNQGATDVFGYEPAEVLGRPFTMIARADDATMDMMMEPIVAGQEVTGTWQAATKTQRSIWIEA